MRTNQDRDWILVGTAIAVIEKEIEANESVLAKIKDARLRTMANELYERYKKLISSPSFNLKLPAAACPHNESFLQNDIDVLLHHALLAPHPEEKLKRLYRHLNNCYWCFDIYAQTFKGYAHAQKSVIPALMQS